MSLSSRAQDTSEAVFENVSYKITGDGTPVSLDIFLPKMKFPDERFPVVMIIHGGGWVEGDKDLETIYYMRHLKERLLEQGLAVISIDYRLVGKTVHLPVPIKDCKDAIRWVKASAVKYHLDGNHIGLWGGSAGGHLALLAAYSTSAAWIDDTALEVYSSKVDCVVDNFGPTDLNRLFKTNMSKFFLFFARLFFKKILSIRDPLIFALSGYHISSDKKKVISILSEYSPLRYVQAGSVPTLIFQGTGDKVVPFEQSALLHQALSHHHTANRLITVKDGDHGFNNISKEQTDDLVGQTVAFMKKMLLGRE
jgi:acetyl esterase/lipase